MAVRALICARLGVLDGESLTNTGLVRTLYSRWGRWPHFACALALERLNNNWDCSKGYSSSSWVPGPRARIPEDQLCVGTCVLTACVSVHEFSRTLMNVVLTLISLISKRKKRDEWKNVCLSTVPISVHAHEGVCVFHSSTHSQELLTPRSLPH